MFKKSIIGIVAGLTLASGAVTAEAAQAPQVSSSLQASTTTAAAAAFRCARYPASVVTRTTLHIRKKVQVRGTRNSAAVHVYANVGTPRGTIRLRARRTNGAHTGWVRHGRLGSDGFVRIPMPRYAHVGRYKVFAKYIPRRCSKWAPSRSRLKYYRVVRG